MSALLVVKNIIEQSGREDLVVDLTDYAEIASGLGAWYWMNRAQRLLDRLQPTPVSDAWYLEKPSAGTFTIKDTQCRAITELWYTDTSTGVRKKVDRVQLANFRSYYAEDPASYDQGAPEYYAIQAFRQAPSQQGDDQSSLDDYEDLIVGAAESYQGVIFMPPSNGNIVYRMGGKFYSPVLSDDADTSYWTEECPEALVLATKWFLEGMYKNENGLKSLMAALEPVLLTIEYDMIETESAGVTHMEG